MLLYAIVLVTCVARVILRNPTPITPRIATAHAPRGSPANWARISHGGRIEVSSYDVRRQHHPSFAIDGRLRGSLMQKWVSDSRDRQPWLQAHLAEAVNITEVVLAHAGAVEAEHYTMHRYTIECRRAGAVVARLEVDDNRASIARHNMSCPATDAVRVVFEVTPPPEPRSVVRLYELQAWGSRR